MCWSKDSWFIHRKVINGAVNAGDITGGRWTLQHNNTPPKDYNIVRRELIMDLDPADP